MTRFRDRYQEIYSLLSRAELQRGSEGLDELHLGPDLFEEEQGKFLGFYTDEGLEIAMQKYGFYRELERMGFEKFRLVTRTEDPDEHLLRLYSAQPLVEEPLVELVAHLSFLRPTGALADRMEMSHVPVLTVDWLILQNPLGSFTPERPPLPGQRYPGLGVGAQVLELLRNICLRLNLAAIVTVPSFFHNALFYSEEFRHFDPFMQGAFLALCRDLMPRLKNSVAAASWALQWKMVRNRRERETSFAWFQELMVDPISEELKAYLTAPEYLAEVQGGLKANDFEVFLPPLMQNMAARGLHPFDLERVNEWLAQE